MDGDGSDPALLRRAAELAIDFLARLPERPVGRPIAPDILRAALGGPLPGRGEDPAAVIAHLARSADPGLVASAGPRYFGFVIGGSLPVTVATEWLAAAWDQNAGNYPASPAASVVEEVAGGWLRELFGLPGASVGFVTGATMANFTGLAAARHAVLEAVGHDVARHGLFGAPPINVVVGEEAHTTIFVALRMLGLGSERVTRVPVDAQGRMRADELRRILAGLAGPTIVCAQAGNVNTGAFDPIAEIAAATNERGAWLHLDGAFGLWAAASPALRGHLAGAERAQSWATDAHKWLNVPYDCGIVFVADSAAHQAAMSVTAAYLVRGAVEDVYQQYDWVPESSRHARGLSVYTALRSLGRAGVAELVERCCALARQMAERLAAGRGVTVLNEVVLNQVLVRFAAPGDDGARSDERTRAVVAAVQRDGTCWAGTTTWHGVVAMRISVSNWSTTAADIDRSAEAILRCAVSEGVAV